MLLRVICSLLAVSLSWGYPNSFYYVPSLSVPERHPELGLYPRYQTLVYNYVSGMAGPHQPAKVNVFPTRIEDFGINNEPALADNGPKEPVTERPGVASLRPSSLLPSDFILLAAAPQSQFFGNFDVIKNKKMKLGVDENALPPLGGVVSNYILQRGTEEKPALVKRQTYYYDTDEDEGVVVNAASTEPRAENGTNNSTNENAKEEPQPSVAQSKPSAIALAGVGGVAQAAPVGTAVVGEGGLAIAAPSATAVAGQGTGGAIQIAGEEKMKKSSNSEAKER